MKSDLLRKERNYDYLKFLLNLKTNNVASSHSLTALVAKMCKNMHTISVLGYNNVQSSTKGRMNL